MINRILFRMKKKCSLDSTCSEDSMYEHCPGPEILLHRENFLIYNKKVPSHRSQFDPLPKYSIYLQKILLFAAKSDSSEKKIILWKIKRSLIFSGVSPLSVNRRSFRAEDEHRRPSVPLSAAAKVTQRGKMLFLFCISIVKIDGKIKQAMIAPKNKMTF